MFATELKDMSLKDLSYLGGRKTPRRCCASLLYAHGPIDTSLAGMQLFVRFIGGNFNAWFAVITIGLYAYGLLPHFGPMRKAAQRALTEGKVLRDGATHTSGKELTIIEHLPGKRHTIILWWCGGMETTLALDHGLHRFGRAYGY